MRDVTGKIEDSGATPAGRLSATEHNDVFNDVNDLITRSGQAINSSDTSQSSEATTLAAFRAAAFNVDGTSTANALILVPVSGSSGHRIPTALGAGSSPVYNRWDGATINFTPTSNNTGPVTINIGQTIGTLLGSKKLFDYSGSALSGGEVISGVRMECQFDSALDSGNGAWKITTAAFVQSDWDQAGSGQPDYIKNKPGTPTESAVGLPEVATQAETDAGTDDTRMITPLKLANTTLIAKPGDIIQRTTQTAIGGNYLECNGQAVSRSTYSALFAEIGTTHGIGDGATTFNLPNIRRIFSPLSTNTFADLSEPITNSINSITIDPTRGDVYACATNEVQRWNKSTGTWTNLSPPAGGWNGIAYDEFNDRVWIVSTGGSVYYTAYSPVSWVSVGAAPSITYLGIAIDGVHGQVYVFSTSAVYLANPSYGTWSLQTTPGSNYRAMAVNQNTGDVYLGDQSGNLYRREDGTGTFIQRRSVPVNSYLVGLATNATSGDLYASDDINVYAQQDRGGEFTVIANPAAAIEVAASHADGSVAYAASNLVKRRPENSISSYIAY